MTSHLEHMVLDEGRIVSRRTLAESPADARGVAPSFARWHVAPGGKLYVIIAGTRAEDSGKSTFGNWIAAVPSDDSPLVTWLHTPPTRRNS